jgi:hypothetical protein
MTGQSESIGELAKALAKAQGQMKPAPKGKENPFFKSSYADLTCCWETARKALADNGLAVVQSTEFDGDGAFLVTLLVHSSGEWVRGRYPVRPAKPDPQSVGSAFTYARRYALCAMVGITAEDEDDDGHAATQPRHDAKPANGPPKNGKPVEGRGKVADSVCAAVSQAKSLAELKSALSLVPKGFADAKDDHYARIVAAKDARKLSLTRDEIDAVAKQLNYDWAKLALAASACDIPNLETMTADEAGKLLESLKADAKEVARASV